MNKNPPLAQHQQNIEIFNLSGGWQATDGPTQNLLTMQPIANIGPKVAQSADHATNSQRRSDSGMLSVYNGNQVNV